MGRRIAVRMGPATRATLLPWLARHRPELRAQYERHYRAGQSVSRAYHEALQRRLAAIQRAVGIEPATGLRMQREMTESKLRVEVQLHLWRDGSA